jgi:hypothetical protein
MFVAEGRRRVADLVVDAIDETAVLADALRVPRRECVVAVAGTERAPVTIERPHLEGATEGVALALDAEAGEFGRRVDLDDGAVVPRPPSTATTLHHLAWTY